uniref:Protein kinase domain-containing protein n=1 Tax=viral metagenome TaxID=1070528 RepID=A0A6C0CQ52_9ZZZZ
MNEKKDRVLGEGSFGCVLSPRVACDYNQERYRPPSAEPMVSKVFTKYDRYFKMEQNIARKIAKWDPRGKYLIVPIESCMSKKQTVEQNKAFQKCKNIPTNVDRFPQISMPYAGDNLINVIVKYSIQYNQKFPIEYWIRILNNILLGIYVMIKNQHVHQDIKPENILIHNGVAKISDFGLTLPFNEIYNYYKNERISYPYFTYPPEYLFATYYYMNKCHSVCDPNEMIQFWDEYLSYFGPNIQQNYEYYLLQNQPMGISVKEVIIKKLNIILYKYQQNPKEWIQDMTQYIDRIDIYALGMTCVMIHHMVDLSGISIECRQKYEAWVLGLIEPEVEKRLTIQQAYQLYREILTLLPK